MTLEVLATPAQGAADSIFDFPHDRATASADRDLVLAHRPDPEPGWAARHPDRALVFLFVTPRDGGLVEELLAL